MNVHAYYLFFHRAAAAFFAESTRSFLVMLLARASPPFGPPNLPKDTAAGFFPDFAMSAPVLNCDA